MKIICRVILILVLLLGIALSVSYAGPEKYGQEISNRKITPIKDILADPKAYEGKTVTVEGKIAIECETGCWFYIKIGETNATIYVDTAPGGFAIPQKVGRHVLVEGKVVIKKTGPMILASGVQIR